MNWTPKSNLAEWCITYRCNLACRNCCRFCYLPPSTADMTLNDVEEFILQSNELAWRPSIWITGGEPTLHPQFLDVVGTALAASDLVLIFSNAFSQASRELLAAAESLRPGCVFADTHKPQGSVAHSRKDHCIAPIDFKVESRPPCHCHAGFSTGCGVSVDAEGYTLCPIGGAIDGILNLGLRTRRLSDLFDDNFAARQTVQLCRNCGCDWGSDQKPSCEIRQLCGVSMTPTWMQAVEKLL